ncbi:hypothetical protein [Streptosporangium roseum]|uniref:Neutral/alkaline non-lysosomal ceramidase N-terminal domain-containing protein n=1 Tax=Streptosporangium roseum (strain ATCC 12428 / DSM 43021 / JCM 3005 / KCTC 9067 / NCIMB 10171 / NRRL 2505 / NI 9100) TaxID=479432 RepID=D2BA19_STRRD|nr:hypothetical protein [Streptosporangium roseum]ACZ86032.1 hypothetical protein Sros_3082 [Streptosporangium roseum DSM 43021]
MRVGHGTARLPVPPGTPMGGYLDRPGVSAGELDPLQVGVITWFDGRRRFALAVADVICVNDDLSRQARQAVSATCELWLAATHTHAGPETGCVPGGGPTPQPWRDRIVEATRTALARAMAAERPAGGSAHQGGLRDVGAARGVPSAEPLVPLDVLAVRDPAGRLAGVLAVLPVHPTVLPSGNLLVSADLVGAVRGALRARLGSGVWVLVATGTAGDISTRHTRRGQDAAELDRLGGLVADRCAELVEAAAAEAWTPGSAIGWASRRCSLARGSSVADPQALLAELRAAHERSRAAGDAIATRMALSRLEGARLLAETPPEPTPGTARPPGGKPPAPITTEVSAVRLGRLALAALPGEPFVATGEAVRRTRPDPTFVLGYVNGYPGYLPTAAAYSGQEYEVLAGRVAPGSAEFLATTVSELLHDLDTPEDS